ncbi:hypothetical protein SPRG_04450 [Saprolegnia parasitica CBS 223.65]|uniref:Putative auto-transporter adhesin head GIN domain-containing protein n=1 Tax=Saprolegnia parasitica (strain CBS 223.65) TaxID=695850 RepID=A0A067CII7_SAPPC|nr:hypothetical protein SPRG_04450 [Saprolegnia parasitica CBS 223.65]KDO30549.1 hypothetical protein SPRG_04450 [Saprolegnia parasitica CBS 223.65]|eukprot:XP_012198764.1 hypothetical protein SPRG_04450 [Saprolegnia parasitica CBS 223.65]
MSLEPYTTSFDAAAVRELRNLLPCRVFVLPDGPPGKVFVSLTASHRSVDHFIVQLVQGVLTLRTTHGHLTGQVLVQVHVDEAAWTATKITNAGGGDLCMDGVARTAQGGHLCLVQDGRGGIYMKTPALSLTRFACHVSGGGAIQVDAGALALCSLDSTVSGHGNIAVYAETVNTTYASSRVQGAGVINLGARKAWHATSVQATVQGSGVVCFRGEGTCVVATATVTGSGRIRTDALTAHEVDASVYGSGSITTQAVHALRAKPVGPGSIYYTKMPPETCHGPCSHLHNPSSVIVPEAAPLPDRVPNAIDVDTSSTWECHVM